MSKHARSQPPRPGQPPPPDEPEVEDQEEVVELHDQIEDLQVENAKLAAQLADAERRSKDAEEQVRQYAVAFDKAKSEFTGAKERMAREHERNLKRDQTKAVSGLLDVLDTLDRSLESAKPGLSLETFVDGVRMIRAQFESALQSMGLQRFDGLGEPFDPARHQAVTTMPVLEAAQDGLVVHSVSAGCVFGDEVVRPAVVVVGKLAEVESGEAT